MSEIKINKHGLAYVNCPYCERFVWLNKNWKIDLTKISYLEISCLCGKLFRVKE